MKQNRPFQGNAKSLRDFKKIRQKKKKRDKASRKRKPKNPKIVESAEKATPSKVWTSFQRGIKWGSVIGVILVVVYIIIYSPLFRIVDPLVTGTSSSALQQHLRNSILKQLEGNILTFFPKNNILFVQPKKLNGTIVTENPIVHTVTTKTNWPHSITTTVTEKQRSIILETRGRYIDIDATGIAYQETPPADLATILQSEKAATLVIHIDNHDSAIKIGDRVGEEAFIVFAKELPRIMDRFTRLEIQKMSTPGIHTRELHIETAEGWLLLLDTSRSAENEIKTLNKIVEEKISKEELKQINYIDLRIREKTFYKLKD